MKRLFLVIFLFLFCRAVSVLIDIRKEVARLENAADVFSDKLPVLLAVSDEVLFEIRLYDNDAARQLVAQLPQKLVMSRWGDGEYHGALKKKITVKKENVRRAYHVGEVALWLKGNALSFLFAPTPASVGTDVPMLISAGAPVGRLVSFETLDDLPAVIELSVEIKK